MRKQLIIGLLALLSLGLMAQEQETINAPQQERGANESKSNGRHRIFTGFSGGMMIHGGYLFADSPEKLFSNTGLGSAEYVKGLPRDGFSYGLGGSLRIHLINHIHVGAEGFVSTMPIMRTGSNIRTGWGGAFLDGYLTVKNVRPFIGLTLGGGSMNRLYVPNQLDDVYFKIADSTHYNASYTTTPFFFLDPYIGLEVDLNSHMALIIRVDYLLPFGKTESKLVIEDAIAGKETKPWSAFMGPSGPRLYVGIMFGRLDRNKKK